MRRSIQNPQRGMTMLMAMGVVMMFSLAAALSLSVVRMDSEVQGQARRAKEAFFAAEAGLAEGRERVRILNGSSTSYSTAVMPALTAATDVGTMADPWYEVLGTSATPVAFTLEPTSAGGTALDDSVATADREMRDVDNDPILGFPTARNVRYRVFLRDDFDEGAAANNPSADLNGRVWLVSVGEVLGENGQLTRSVVRALITNSTGNPASSNASQKGGTAAKDSDFTFDVDAPDVSESTVL